MDRQTAMKFKQLFEEQKLKLVSTHIFNDEFTVSQDDLLDETDLTSSELETSMRMRLRSREALYLRKIDEALVRIQDGSFGQCEDCGDEIEARRLEARPTTSMCMICKEAQEARERIHIDGRKYKSLGARVRLA